MKRSPLKRGKGLVRKTPLEAPSAPLERRTPLARGSSPLSRARRLTVRPRAPEEADAKRAREAWHKLPKGAVCAVCGAGGDLDCHHIVPKQRLKRIARKRGIPAWYLLWDPRGRLVVCRPCHDMHERAQRRIGRGLLTKAAIGFASDLGEDSYIERTYP